jgi:hypothetical protein
MTHSQTSLDQDLRTGVWYCHGATVFTLKEEPGRYHNGQPLLVNDHSFLVQGPNAEAVAAQVHSALTAPPRPDHAGGVERVRHLKRGTEYEVLGEAEAQVSTGFNGRRFLEDGKQLVVYRDPANGKLWCRFADEFRDGRFETITPAQAPDKAAEREGVDKKRLIDAIDSAIDSLRFYHADGIADALDVAADNYLNAALAPKPTGTEAGRGVGVEAPSSQAMRAAVELEILYVVGGVTTQALGRLIDQAIAATPTPPTPDSTAPAGALRQVRKQASECRDEAKKRLAAEELPQHDWYISRAEALEEAACEFEKVLTPSAPIAAPVRDAEQVAKALIAEWEGHKKGSLPAEYEYGYEAALQHVIYAANKAGPAPAGDVPGEAQPTPDSTAQGDGTSREGNPAPVRDDRDHWLQVAQAAIAKAALAEDEAYRRMALQTIEYEITTHLKAAGLPIDPAVLTAPVRDDGAWEASQQELRQHWEAFCDADQVPDSFIERMETAGFAQLRKVTKDDLQDCFAAERGIERGGYVWDLTKAGREILDASLLAPAGDVPGASPPVPADRKGGR